MKKKIIAVSAICAAITMSAGLAACDKTPKDEGTYYTVTYYSVTADGKAGDVLKTERVKEGEVAPAYTPEAGEGKEFVDWFATPSRNHRYDVTTPVTGDVRVYAGFSVKQNDTRDYWITGAGTSTVLIDGWGTINDAHKLTKTEGKNEYKITLDLIKGDEFVLIAGAEYESKRGAGYLVTSTLADGTEVFGGAGSVYDDSSKGKNIKVEYSGNYTLTLNTYPGDDYYNTSGQGYTEERKEIYRMGTYDTISWVRNGDAQVTSTTITDFYIKGSGISDWGNYIDSYHTMTRDGDNYSLSIYLKENEQFMFASQNTVISNGQTNVSGGSAVIKSNNLDEASREIIDGYTEAGANMVAKASGVYTFNYKKSTDVLSVTFTAGTETQYDYYLDGIFGGHSWDETKMEALTNNNGVHSITLELKKDDVLAIRGYAVGTATPAYSGCPNPYNYAFFKANSAFENKSNNIGCLVAGTYTVSINNYTKAITIVDANVDPYDIYIKGGMNGWKHDFKTDYRLERNKTDENLYEITLDFEVDWPLGLEEHPAGETTGTGKWVGLDNLGTSGDANDKFAVTSGNLTCNTAGKYTVVYNVETKKIDFYVAK